MHSLMSFKRGKQVYMRIATGTDAADCSRIEALILRLEGILTLELIQNEDQA